MSSCVFCWIRTEDYVPIKFRELLFESEEELYHGYFDGNDFYDCKYRKVEVVTKWAYME